MQCQIYETVVRRLADSLCEQITRRLQRITDAPLSGEGAGLGNAWGDIGEHPATTR